MKKYFFIIILFFIFALPVEAENLYTTTLDDASSEYFEIADQTYYSLISGVNENLTVSLWVRPHDLSGFNTLVSKWANTGGTATEWLIATNGTSIFMGCAGSWYTAYTFTANIWTHIAITCDDLGNQAFYINGGEVDTGSYTITSGTRGPVRIGQNTNANYFDGDIDEVRIWDRVLSTSEIGDIYNCSFSNPTTETDLQGDWYFDEQDGTDISKNGNDATAYNTPTYQSASLPFTDTCVGETTATTTFAQPIQTSGGDMWLLGVFVGSLFMLILFL